MIELLQYLFLAMPYVVVVALALLICIFLVTAYRTPTAGLVAVGFLCWFETLIPNAAPLQLGLQIYVPDIISILLGLLAFMRAIFSRNRPPLLISWYLFVLSIGLSFAIGISNFGTYAGGALRPNFYAVAIASYFMTFSFDEARIRRAISGLSWIGLGLVAAVFARWLIVEIPISGLLPPGGSFDVAGTSKLRTVNAEQAAVIAQIFLVGLFYPQTSALLQGFRLLVPLFALAIIGLQHRSVWLGVLAAIGSRFVLPTAGRRGSTQLLMLSIVLGLIMTPVVLSGQLGGIAQDISRSATRAVALTDTAQVRLESWTFAINKWRTGGPRALAIGLPMGTSMDRYSLSSNNELRKISFQAHNYFVQTLFSTGLIGLGSSLFVYAWVMRKLYRLASDPAEGPAASALLLMLVLQLAFYVTYGITYMQGFVLGLAAAYAMTKHVHLKSAIVLSKITKPLPSRMQSVLHRG